VTDSLKTVSAAMFAIVAPAKSLFLSGATVSGRKLSIF